MLFLEENPKLCALTTPKSLIPSILKGIELGYNLASQASVSQERYNDLPRSIASMFSSSQKSYEWLLTYYSVLTHNLGREPKQLSLTPLKKNRLYSYKPLYMFDPMWLKQYLPIVNENYEKYSTCGDIILKSRMLLEDMNPTQDEFIKGMPEWLLSNRSNGTIIEDYDELTHTHIKIVSDKDRYRFYTSYKTDNWVEVPNVPTEMSKIVRYLLTNKPLNLED